MNDTELQQRFIDCCTLGEFAFIKPHKMSQAKLIAEKTGQDIFEVVMDLQLINMDRIKSALVEATDYPFIDPLVQSFSTQFSKKVLSTVSPKAAAEHKVFPLQIFEGKLHLAMANPTDEDTVLAMEKMSGYAIERYVSYPKNILRAVVRYYNVVTEKTFEELISDALDETQGKMTVEMPQSIWTEPISEALTREIHLFPPSKTPIRKGEVSVSLIIQKILSNAIYLGASDIHFEPFEDAIKVRFRKDGLLFSQWFIPRDIQTNVFNRIKVMAGIDLATSKKPLDGYISYENVLPVGVDIRVSVVPSIYGERVALRLLDKCRGLYDTGFLGMEDDHLAQFHKMIKVPQGLILMTGPTGSGKTTSIYAALDKLNTDQRCIITIEEPIEYEIQGINQIQVNAKKELGFAEAFRAVLRQNPDVILLGEIRDPESAQVAVNASSTGHLVFSTLHTNDAAHAIPRLISMGCDRYVLSNALQLIVAQRLVRRLCPQCRRPDPLGDERIKELGLSDEELKGRKFSIAGECNECSHLGYVGRIGVFELLQNNHVIQEMIVNDEPGIYIERKAVEMGMRSLREDALLKAAKGITSLDEVVRMTSI